MIKPRRSRVEVVRTGRFLPDGSADFRRLRRVLTLANPLHHDRRGRTDAPPHLRFFERVPGGLVIPREYPLTTRGIVLDRTVPGDRVPIKSRIELRAAQRGAVRELVRRNGVLEAPCGAGKTVVLLEAISRIGRLALVLVHTEVLLRQWVERASEHLELSPHEIGVFGGGKADWEGRSLVVALVQSAHNVPRELVDRVGVVVTDECHHAAAPTWCKVITRFPARRRLGATATLRRADGLDRVFLWHIGPVVARMTRREVLPDMRLISTGIEPDPERLTTRGRFDPGKLATALNLDPERQLMVAELTATLVGRGRKVLVLVDRRLAAVQIATRIAEIRPDVPVGCCLGSLTGAEAEAAEDGGLEVSVSGNSGPRREARREHLARPVIIATAQLLREGFDRPDMDVLIDAGVYSDHGDAEQAVGRIVRPLEGKPRPLVFFLEDDHETARRMVSRKLRGVRRRGWTVRRMVYGEELVK